MKCKPRNFSLWFILVIIKNKNYGIGYKVLKHLIVAFWGCLTYQKVTRIKFAKVEKNTKMSTTRPNYIHIANERSLSLNDSLWIVLARTFWTNWTGSNIFLQEDRSYGWRTSFNNLYLFFKTTMILLCNKWFFFIISILWWKNLDANLPYFCHIFLIFIIIFYIFQFIFFLYKFASKFFVITRSSLLQIQIFKSYEIVFYTLFTLYIIHYWVIILLNTDLYKSTFPIISQNWVFCALVFRVSLSLVFSFSVQCFQFNVIEVVYVTIENSAFCLALYLIGVHFRG